MVGMDRVKTAQAGERLEGIVVSRDGVTLEGAVVNLEGVGSVNTNAAGIFVFHDVPSGNYRLTVYKKGFPDEARMVPVLAGRSNTVQITLAGIAPIPPPFTPVKVPIVRQGSALLVHGRVNEQVDTLFLVDTGATFCVLTKATADRLGLTPNSGTAIVTVHTASGPIEAPLTRVDVIQVGDAEARSIETIIHDVPGLPPTVGAILGLSFLNQFKVEIDPVERVMLLSR
jgi:clan AA aspartic protease (TIGR02281 family)